MRGSNWAVVLALLLLSGPLVSCRIVIPGPLPADAGPEVQRDAGYALLMEVLRDESSVAELLSIKDVPKQTASIVKMIASDSSAAVKKLNALATAAPPISFKKSGLPVVETEARTWIANRTTVALLGTSGERLENNLLLSQLKATEYIAALANGLLKNEPAQERRSELRRIKQKFADLNMALFNRLQAIESVEKKNAASST